MASLLVTIREGTWIACTAAKVLMTLAFDRLCRVFAHNDIPLSVAALNTPETMSALLRTRVERVASDREKQTLSERAQLGAGGTGTCRSWLALGLADGGERRVFCKLPAATTFEAMFLTAFGVYKNEVDFYAQLPALRSRFRPGLFGDVHVATRRRCRFALVLEDISARPGGMDLPTAKSPHPAPQVRAALAAYAALHSATWNDVPPGVWTDATSYRRVGGAPTRPPFLRVVADATLKAVLRRFPGLLPPDVEATYRHFLANYAAVRRHWSAGVLCLAHGDAHLGNIAFAKETGLATFYDLQCVAAEHPMRDVAYHLQISCDASDLAANERAYVAHYVAELRRLRPDAILTEADAWAGYRLHALWALCALVISAGASDLFEESMARLTISRVVAAMQRIDSRGALDDVVRREGGA